MFGKTTMIKVEGMSCGHCEKRVTDAVLAIEGVKKCKASAKKGEVAVQLGGNDALLPQVEAAIEEAGYTVVK